MSMRTTVRVRQDLTVIISEPVRDALGGVKPGDILELDIQKLQSSSGE